MQFYPENIFKLQTITSKETQNLRKKTTKLNTTEQLRLNLKKLKNY